MNRRRNLSNRSVKTSKQSKSQSKPKTILKPKPKHDYQRHSKVAVIVEPRRHNALELVVQNI